MPFKDAVTVKTVLEKIHTKEYLLPSIQREYVWNQDQILTLIDSLMRGYPIGSFLFWDVKPESVAQYNYFDFITNFHEKLSPYAEKAVVPADRGIVGVLDGQQRLTSLNIAFYGSYTQKKKGAWSDKADSYKKKYVYLNLLEDPDQEELGHQFLLKFLSEDEAGPDADGVSKWFHLKEVLYLQDLDAIEEAIEKRGLDPKKARKRLLALWQSVVIEKSINWYLEEAQDADKVLDIFVRVNSAGTTLSNSDLLLSMATNQWSELDAREEVKSLVGDLRGYGFEFSKDTVLKAALMLCDLPVGFKVSNFTAENMAKVESKWQAVRLSLMSAASLLKKFGYTAQNLNAYSVILPLAYYLSRHPKVEQYVELPKFSQDRSLIQTWVSRVLIKKGIWGSGLDQLLTKVRDAIASSEPDVFPLTKIQAEMAALGKSLVFDEAEIDGVLSESYGSKYVFTILTLLYPGLDLESAFHEDHIFPKSKLTKKYLSSNGFSPTEVDSIIEKVNQLPNLQLLKGPVNLAKLDKLPQEWLLSDYFKNEPAKLATYLSDNDLGNIDLGLENFLGYFNERKSRMRTKLLALLNS